MFPRRKKSVEKDQEQVSSRALVPQQKEQGVWDTIKSIAKKTGEKVRSVMSSVASFFVKSKDSKDKKETFTDKLQKSITPREQTSPGPFWVATPVQNVIPGQSAPQSQSNQRMSGPFARNMSGHSVLPEPKGYEVLNNRSPFPVLTPKTKDKTKKRESFRKASDTPPDELNFSEIDLDKKVVADIPDFKPPFKNLDSSRHVGPFPSENTVIENDFARQAKQRTVKISKPKLTDLEKAETSEYIELQLFKDSLEKGEFESIRVFPLARINELDGKEAKFIYLEDSQYQVLDKAKQNLKFFTTKEEIEIFNKKLSTLAVLIFSELGKYNLDSKKEDLNFYKDGNNQYQISALLAAKVLNDRNFNSNGVDTYLSVEKDKLLFKLFDEEKNETVILSIKIINSENQNDLLNRFTDLLEQNYVNPVDLNHYKVSKTSLLNDISPQVINSSKIFILDTLKKLQEGQKVNINPSLLAKLTFKNRRGILWALRGTKIEKVADNLIQIDVNKLSSIELATKLKQNIDGLLRYVADHNKIDRFQTQNKDKISPHLAVKIVNDPNLSQYRVEHVSVSADFKSLQITINYSENSRSQTYLISLPIEESIDVRGNDGKIQNLSSEELLSKYATASYQFSLKEKSNLSSSELNEIFSILKRGVNKLDFFVPRENITKFNRSKLDILKNANKERLRVKSFNEGHSVRITYLEGENLIEKVCINGDKKEHYSFNAKLIRNVDSNKLFLAKYFTFFTSEIKGNKISPFLALKMLFDKDLEQKFSVNYDPTSQKLFLTFSVDSELVSFSYDVANNLEGSSFTDFNVKNLNDKLKEVESRSEKAADQTGEKLLFSSENITSFKQTAFYTLQTSLDGSSSASIEIEEDQVVWEEDIEGIAFNYHFPRYETLDSKILSKEIVGLKNYFINNFDIGSDFVFSGNEITVTPKLASEIIKRGEENVLAFGTEFSDPGLKTKVYYQRGQNELVIVKDYPDQPEPVAYVIKIEENLRFFQFAYEDDYVLINENNEQNSVYQIVRPNTERDNEVNPKLVKEYFALKNYLLDHYKLEDDVAFINSELYVTPRAAAIIQKLAETSQLNYRDGLTPEEIASTVTFVDHQSDTFIIGKQSPQLGNIAFVLNVTEQFPSLSDSTLNRNDLLEFHPGVRYQQDKLTGYESFEVSEKPYEFLVKAANYGYRLEKDAFADITNGFVMERIVFEGNGQKSTSKIKVKIAPHAIESMLFDLLGAVKFEYPNRKTVYGFISYDPDENNLEAIKEKFRAVGLGGISLSKAVEALKYADDIEFSDYSKTFQLLSRHFKYEVNSSDHETMKVVDPFQDIYIDDNDPFATKEMIVDFFRKNKIKFRAPKDRSGEYKYVEVADKKNNILRFNFTSTRLEKQRSVDTTDSEKTALDVDIEKLEFESNMLKNEFNLVMSKYLPYILENADRQKFLMKAGANVDFREKNRIEYNTQYSSRTNEFVYFGNLKRNFNSKKEFEEMLKFEINRQVDAVIRDYVEREIISPEHLKYSQSYFHSLDKDKNYEEWHELDMLQGRKGSYEIRDILLLGNKVSFSVYSPYLEEDFKFTIRMEKK